ncbi:PREDICTED: tRNA-dihydrouridine(20) synthase [NAD(P)+]-like isoform X1 [Rhagoletis zephyria]|uniref:tRNA-dihydrouridine(20) synthase [NAD(P)+]-like isoform X1 n=1 Tax=Rhagoletis zephyria TaxID=28612 RepID=UPI0008118431|nr:PREDICTED: tRNA-dihydrouridine(20) synthase [NAD(P)+]-like isoform X1 [Rhagoletis zephyria]
MRFKSFLRLLQNMTLGEKATQLDYRNKVIMAPMVRVGTLPMRLLALESGADIVYTEELVDLKLIRSKRRVNAALGTVDFVDRSDGTIVFRTCAKERQQVVLQLGTSDAERALAVGKLVEHDIAGLDINMGCPKEFSIKGGMGVALLGQPDKAEHILKTLCKNLSIPVTCKIRILPDLNDTVKLVQRFAAAGIAAIAVHARTRDERPQHAPHPEFIREIARAVDIPVIANGGSREIQKYKDILSFRDLCGATSVMVARAAQLNVSIFRKEGMLPMDDIIVKYLKLSVDYDNAAHNTKYCVQNILKELQETPRGKQFLQCQTLQQMCEIWSLGDYCYRKQLELKRRGNFGRREVAPGVIPDDDTAESPDAKRQKKDALSLDADVIQHNIAFLRSNYNSDTKLPKTMLYTYAGRKSKDIPHYETQRVDKLFRAICSFDGKRYTSSFWEKNKKQAEQGAALVCLLDIGVVSEDDLIKNGSILR